ncbi:MAG: polymer-forming cytoskeletal protein [Spirochaetales bacterium]|nr:polymer-forming cytoskeletal protein [Spirochaetales bacterium]
MPVPKDVLVNTLLGPESSFRGDLVVDGFVRVDGDMRGSIRASGKVVVSESARCDASIVARAAVVGGVVRGDVCVSERLTILDGGVIVGDVFAPRLDADGDIVIHGDVAVPGSIEGTEEAMLAFIRRRGSKIRPFGFDAPIDEVRMETATATGQAWRK